MSATKSNNSFAKSIKDDYKTILIIILVVIFIKIFIVSPSFVPTSSMYPTIKPGDYLLITKYNYGYSNANFSLFSFTPNLFNGRIMSSTPKRGDIIVFRSKNSKRNIPYVKRLIGLPGDKIEFYNDNIYINDQVIKSEYLNQIKDEQGQYFTQYQETLPKGLSYNIVRIARFTLYNSLVNKTYFVPENKYFFLGDNRDNSLDSRFDIGYVDHDDLVGKAVFIWFSTGRKLFDFNNWNINFIEWFKSIRFDRVFTSLY